MSLRSLPRQKRTLKKASITNQKCLPVSATTTAGARGVMLKSSPQEVRFSNEPELNRAGNLGLSNHAALQRTNFSNQGHHCSTLIAVDRLVAKACLCLFRG